MPTTSRRSPPPAASPTSRSHGRSSRECRHRTQVVAGRLGRRTRGQKLPGQPRLTNERSRTCSVKVDRVGVRQPFLHLDSCCCRVAANLAQRDSCARCTDRPTMARGVCDRTSENGVKVVTALVCRVQGGWGVGARAHGTEGPLWWSNDVTVRTGLSRFGALWCWTHQTEGAPNHDSPEGSGPPLHHDSSRWDPH